MYPQQTLNIIQFYHKLSKKSLGIWLETLWLHWWLLCERCLNEWLRAMLATLWMKLWKNPGASFKEWLRASLIASFTMYPLCPPRIPCDPISGHFLKVITMYSWGNCEWIEGHFQKVISMSPLGKVWTNCLKNHNVISMYPPVNWPLAPSGSRWQRVQKFLYVSLNCDQESKPHGCHCDWWIASGVLVYMGLKFVLTTIMYYRLSNTSSSG